MQRQEQALVAKPTVERLDELLIRWLSWPAEIELYTIEVRP